MRLVSVDGLVVETTYYVRTYITNVLGTFYGNQVSFTTPLSINAVYLDDNGITIKAKEWAEVGMTGVVDGVTYTIVDRPMLETMIANEEDVTVVCTTLISDMHTLFYDNQNFNQLIGNWDVSNVTDMNGMFARGIFNQNINSWDVSSVTNMQGMFGGNDNFDTHYITPYNMPLDNWDVSSVTNMMAMFNASAFNQDISSWDVSSVTNMQGMFSNATSFDMPLDNWDVSNVTIMHAMFFSSNELPFNQPIGNWDVSNVTDMNGMFGRSKYFNQDISGWNVSNVTDMWWMFIWAEVFNQDLSNWDVSNVNSCNDFCDNTPSWTLPKPNFTNCSDDLGCE